jgi:hypothetical protein
MFQFRLSGFFLVIEVIAEKFSFRYAASQVRMPRFGGVAEWSIAPVLKTGNGKPFVSSNLTASAKPLFFQLILSAGLVKARFSTPRLSD